MPHLIHWDATTWEAGSILPTDEPGLKVVSGRERALQAMQRAAARVQEQVRKEVRQILDPPNRFRFDSGYTHYALAIALPGGTESVAQAVEWLSALDEEGEPQVRRTLIACVGADVRPPDGDETAVDPQECLDMLFEFLR